MNQSQLENLDLALLVVVDVMSVIALVMARVVLINTAMGTIVLSMLAVATALGTVAATVGIFMTHKVSLIISCCAIVILLFTFAYVLPYIGVVG